MTSSALAVSALTASLEPTGTANITLSAPKARVTSHAPCPVEPVAIASSTIIANRPTSEVGERAWRIGPR